MFLVITEMRILELSGNSHHTIIVNEGKQRRKTAAAQHYVFVLETGELVIKLLVLYGGDENVHRGFNLQGFES